MKKQITIIFSAICFLLTGCAASVTKRGMLVDNMYYSTYSPNIQIKVSPDFSYHAGKTGQFQHQFQNNTERKYVYIHHFRKEPNTTQVDYYHNPSNWIFWDVQPSEKIESGTVNILNEKWQFCHYFKHLSTGTCALFKDVAIFTRDHDVFKIRYVKVLLRSNWDRQDVDNLEADFSKDIEITNYEIGEDTDQIAFFNQGIALLEEGQYNRSIAYFDKAIEINPKYAEAYYNRGLAYENKGLYDKAFSAYTKTIEINPSYACAYNNRGQVYCYKGQYDKAVADCTKAIEINPKYVEAYDNRGFVYYLKGQYDKAVADCTKAIEINPNYAKAYYNRGNAYLYRKEYEKAWDDVYKAQNLGYKIPSGFLKNLRQASGREK